MRTTINLDDDVAAAVRRLQDEAGLGVSQAVNRLARAGLAVKPTRTRFRQRTARLDLRSSSRPEERCACSAGTTRASRSPSG